MIFLKKVLLLVFLGAILIPFQIRAQEDETPVWPKDIITNKYVITLYQPENASYLDNKLKSNLAFAVKEEGKEPKFGMLWTTSILDVDRNSRQASLASVKIDEIRYGEDVSEEQREQFQDLLNKEMPKWSIEFPLDDLLEQLEEVSVTISELKNDPPKIIFATEPTALILIDGVPKFKDAEKGVQLVENTDIEINSEIASTKPEVPATYISEKSKVKRGTCNTT